MIFASGPDPTVMMISGISATGGMGRRNSISDPGAGRRPRQAAEQQAGGYRDRDRGRAISQARTVATTSRRKSLTEQVYQPDQHVGWRRQEDPLDETEPDGSFQIRKKPASPMRLRMNGRKVFTAVFRLRASTGWR